MVISGVPDNPVAVPVRLPTNPPVDVVTPVTSRLSSILTFFVVVIPVLLSNVAHVPPAPTEDPPPPPPLPKAVLAIPTHLDPL